MKREFQDLVPRVCKKQMDCLFLKSFVALTSPLCNTANVALLVEIRKLFKAYIHRRVLELALPCEGLYINILEEFISKEWKWKAYDFGDMLSKNAIIISDARTFDGP